MGYVRITGRDGVVKHDSRWSAPGGSKKIVEAYVSGLRSSNAATFDESVRRLEGIAKSEFSLPIGRPQRRPDDDFGGR